MESSVCRTGLAAVLGVMFAGAAQAEDRVLRIEGFAGPFEQVLRNEIVPAFSAKFNIRAEYVAGNPVDQIARMVTGKPNPQTDVFITDDGPMYRAIELGLCGKAEGLPVADMIENARFKDDRAVGLGIVTGGISYNAKYFAEHGWNPPTSWNDLGAPRYRGLLAFAPVNNTWGLLSLVMLARANGGSESNMEPGFAAMKAIAPNVVAFDYLRTNEMYQTGQIVITVTASPRARAMINSGFPLEYVLPKEGAPAVLVSACPVARPDALPAAQTFIQYLLAPEVQQLAAEKLAHAPVNRKAVLTAAVSRTMPSGESAARLVWPDWTVINAHRAEWDKRWTREIER